MSKPLICILKTDGTNCDVETARAFEVAGGAPEVVHVNQLRSRNKKLKNYKALAIPGGFSYGDDVASGKVLAVELINYLSKELNEYIKLNRPIIGICNGFQVLVKTGMLPDRKLGNQSLTLAHNNSGKFERRWINLGVPINTKCKFISAEDLTSGPVPMQIAHGEGRLYGSESGIADLHKNGQVIFYYSDDNGNPTMNHPQNPNGSVDSITGICDESGLILGMMPHPERSIDAFHPDRAQTEYSSKMGLLIFERIVNHASKS